MPVDSSMNQILFSIRDYEIYADGELAVSCISRWIILDLKTNRPQRFDSSFETQYKTEDKCVFGEAKLPHLESPEAFTREVPITIRRCDIDYNDHVHNLIYIDYYNNRRIKLKLKGLSPVQYRTKSFLPAY